MIFSCFGEVIGAVAVAVAVAVEEEEAEEDVDVPEGRTLLCNQDKPKNK